MISHDTLGLFIAATLAVNLSPGPSVHYISSVASSRGLDCAVYSVAGMLVGIFLQQAKELLYKPCSWALSLWSSTQVLTWVTHSSQLTLATAQKGSLDRYFSRLPGAVHFGLAGRLLLLEE